MKSGPRLLTLLLLAIATSSHAAVYINDEFDYADGNLGTPWIITNATGGSSAIVGDAETLNDFTPSGQQATFTRPTTSGGQVGGTLASGANPDTSAWSIANGDFVRLTLDFNFSNMINGTAFSFYLRGAGSTALFGLRVQGNSTGNTARVQYMTTNSTGSFIDVTDTPTLSLDTWYRLTVDLDVTSSTTTTFGIALDHLGTGGGSIYDQGGFGLTATSSFLGTGSFQTNASSGVPSYAIADLALVPEPTTASILLATGLLGLLVRRRNRQA